MFSLPDSFFYQMNIDFCFPAGSYPMEQTHILELEASYNMNSRAVEVSWTDYNGELTDEYVLERKTDDGEFEELISGVGQLKNQYSEELKPTESHAYTYRVKIKSGSEEKYSLESISADTDHNSFCLHLPYRYLF